MEESSLDTDIDNYSKTDILKLLDLDANAPEVERNDAVDNIITNMRNKNNSELVQNEDEFLERLNNLTILDPKTVSESVYKKFDKNIILNKYEQFFSEIIDKN